MIFCHLYFLPNLHPHSRWVLLSSVRQVPVPLTKSNVKSFSFLLSKLVISELYESGKLLRSRDAFNLSFSSSPNADSLLVRVSNSDTCSSISPHFGKRNLNALLYKCTILDSDDFWWWSLSFVQASRAVFAPCMCTNWLSSISSPIVARSRSSFFVHAAFPPSRHPTSLPWWATILFSDSTLNNYHHLTFVPLNAQNLPFL